MVLAMSRIFIISLSLLWASMVFISWDGGIETTPAQAQSMVETVNR
jgi:hypothetical protein